MSGEAPRGDSVGGIIKGLAAEPAYLLVFGLAFLLSGSVWLTTLPQSVAVLTTLGALALALAAIVLVERRKGLSLPTESSAQRDRLAKVSKEELAIRGVLEGLADEDIDACFVYSSTEVEGFISRGGGPIEFPFSKEERQVTSILDAFGIAKVHSLLHLAGKRRRLDIVTSETFPQGYWDRNLILVGSDNANEQTAEALQMFKSPFRFNEDVSAVVDLEGKQKWPSARKALQQVDYGLILKLKVEGGETPQVILILAGIGAVGTLACCHYFETRIAEFHEKFSDSPFACVISVQRSVGYTSAAEVTSRRIPPFRR